MAVDTAKFALKLVDGMSGPAKRSARSLDDLQKEIRETERAVMRLEKIQERASGKHHSRLRKDVRAQLRAQRINVRHLRMQARHARSLQRAGGGRAGGAIGSFGSMLGANLATAGISMAGRMVSGVGRAVVGGAGDLMGRAAQTDQHIFALQRLTGQGRQTFNTLRQLSGDYGIGLDDTAEAYKKFLAGGFEGTDAIKFIKLGADMKAMGNTDEQTKGIFLAMSQMKALGRVSAEELNQLSERNVGRAKMAANIATILGKSQKETNNLLNQGKVSAEVGLRAVEMTIQQMTGTTVAGEAGREAAKKTIQGMVGMAKARAGLFWDTLGQKAAPGIREGAKTAFEGLQKFFESDRGQRMFESLGNAAENFGVVVRELGAWVPTALDAFITGFQNANGELGNAEVNGNKFRMFLDSTIPVIEDLGFVIGVTADALQRLLGLFGAASGHQQTLDLFAAKISAATGGKVGSTRGFAAATATLGANSNGGLVTGIAGGVATVKAAPGEGLASIGRGEQIIPAGEQMRGEQSISVGDITIHVDGSGDPEAVAAATMHAFESQLTTLFAGAMA